MAAAGRMEYLCIAVDIGTNMGPRTSKTLRDTDKASTHLDLALYSLLSMVNRKVSLSRRCTAMPAAAATLAYASEALTVALPSSAADREPQAPRRHRDVRGRGYAPALPSSRAVPEHSLALIAYADCGRPRNRD